LLIVGARKLQDKRLQEAHQQLARSNQLIRRYVPSQLAEKIIAGEHSDTSHPQRVKLTIFFSDVEGFTDASDRMDPEELASILNEYLSEMTVIAERYGATINQLVGDGIMIFFGAPQATNDRDHALRAVHMASDMQRRMLELKAGWMARGIEKPLQARIGIHTGYASVGDYGSQGRKTYSAIGVQTNLAARIQSLCAPGKVLISHSTWALVHEDVACIDKGEFQLKGVHYPVRVYEVADGEGAALASAS
jgi:class 3 adenylate cyclase